MKGPIKMTARTRKAPAAKTSTKAPVKTSTTVAVIEPENVVLEGIIVDETTPAPTKKARIDHSTHSHASSKSARATCRETLKKAASAKA